MSKHVSPSAVMLSKRANVFYLEYCRVQMFGERVVYLNHEGKDFDAVFNIPEKNTAFILLGKGTSITQPAVRRLAESQVLVGFCGSGGSPPFGTVDHAFLNMQSEYRPTNYMQNWAHMWFNDKKRIEMSKRFLLQRLAWLDYFWGNIYDLKAPIHLVDRISNDISKASTTQELLLAEARWAKGLYAQVASEYNVNNFSRVAGDNEFPENSADRVNGMLDQGNYIAYGYAATTLSGLGLSYMFPVLHGKTRRGALVFDVADLFKDAIVLPLAFREGFARTKNQEFREKLIETCFDNKLLDHLFDFLKKCCEKTK